MSILVTLAERKEKILTYDGDLYYIKDPFGNLLGTTVDLESAWEEFFGPHKERLEEIEEKIAEAIDEELSRFDFVDMKMTLESIAIKLDSIYPDDLANDIMEKIRSSLREGDA